MARWVLAVLLGVGAATGKSDLISFFYHCRDPTVTVLAGLDIACRRPKIWIVGQSAGQNSPSNQRASQKTVGRYCCLLLHAARVRRYLDCHHVSYRNTSTSPGTAGEGSEQGQDLSCLVLSCLVLSCLACFFSISLWQLGSDLAGDG